MVQAASIDEFYLDLSGTERLFHQEPLEATAQENPGGGPGTDGDFRLHWRGNQKLIAKLAAGRAKPGRVHVVPPGRRGGSS